MIVYAMPMQAADRILRAIGGSIHWVFSRCIGDIRVCIIVRHVTNIDVHVMISNIIYSQIVANHIPVIMLLLHGQW